MHLLSYAGAAAGEDEALRTVGWVADRVAERLAAFSAEVTAVQPGTRSGLEVSLRQGGDGFAAFCHGREDALLGLHDGSGREAVLDRDNAALLRGMWGYALACRAGVELPGIAVAAGASAFAAYESAMMMEWSIQDVEALPTEIREALIQMLALVPLSLAQGHRDLHSMKQALFDLDGSIIGWCDENPDGAPGLEITVQQLHRRLVLQP